MIPQFPEWQFSLQNVNMLFCKGLVFFFSPPVLQIYNYVGNNKVSFFFSSIFYVVHQSFCVNKSAHLIKAESVLEYEPNLALLNFAVLMLISTGRQFEALLQIKEIILWPVHLN